MVLNRLPHVCDTPFILMHTIGVPTTLLDPIHKSRSRVL